MRILRRGKIVLPRMFMHEEREGGMISALSHPPGKPITNEKEIATENTKGMGDGFVFFCALCAFCGKFFRWLPSGLLANEDGTVASNPYANSPTREVISAHYDAPDMKCRTVSFDEAFGDSAAIRLQKSAIRRKQFSLRVQTCCFLAPDLE